VVTAVDWGRYRACPVCPAGLGEACLEKSGFAAEGVVVSLEVAEGSVVSLEADEPHTGRKLRTGYGR
jgi:hypothetical protein